MAAEPASPPEPPPDLRVATDESKECDVCAYYERGRCTAYHNLPVDVEWWCSHFKASGRSDEDAQPRTLRGAGEKAREMIRAGKQQ